MDPISGFDGYDQMMLGQTETEISEPTTSQSSAMPSPYESNAVEENAFNVLAAGGTVKGSLPPAAAAAPAPAPVMAAPAPSAGIPSWVWLAVAAGAAVMLLRKKG
jgi:hypothetical protein